MQEKIKRFLEGSNYRDVKILNHTSGFRVQLFENYKEISFSTGYSLESTFDDALKQFENNRLNFLEVKKNILKNDIEKLTLDLKNKQKQLKEFSNV